MPDSISSIEAFVNAPEILQILDDLQHTFGAHYERLIVSDVLDKEGHQYVDLVQEGGGVLGIALLGYTYILESCGIRFRRLAGTSAGAINTALLTVIGNKNEAKSPTSLQYLCEKNLFDFVDGHPAARWLIKNFIRRKDFFQKIKGLIMNLVLVLSILLVLNIISIWFVQEQSWIRVGKIISLLTILYLLVVGGFIGFIVYLLKRFKRANYGIARGDDFLLWLKKIMAEHGVNTIDELTVKAAAMPGDIVIRAPRTENTEGLDSDVTFIASEVMTENKIEFPKMWYLFTTDRRTLHPAEFVRASMSIPVFFKSYFINDIQTRDPGIISNWEESLGVLKVPPTVRFVDGGILSNFPMSIFYNKNVEIPRMPTFGIRLDESDPDKKESEVQLSFLGYIRRMFNTARFYYDKDFLIKNKMYTRGIKTINVHGFNWLNFYMKEKDRIALFIKGAQAAKEFLASFAWEAYKQERAEGQRKLENK